MTYQLGIDLGTTYSAAAILRDREVVMVSLGVRSLEVPSVVFLREDGEFLVGEAAERRGQADPGRLAREFKRRIGDPVPLLLAGSPYSPQALTARLLRWIVDAVSAREGGPPTRTVVTHPANWGPFKLDVLLQAIQLADVPNVRLAPEPLAAAVHYASTTRVSPGDTVAVYDLGGGTFDAAVLRKTMEWFEVLGRPEGIEHLGGIDFDEAVFGYVTRALGDQLKLDRRDPAAAAGMARLRRECVEAKEALSVDSDVSIPVLLPGLQTEIRLTRGEFEGMIRPAIGETINALRRTLRSANVEPEALKAVVLVGGSGRIPLVGELVQAEFGVPIAIDVHPKHAMAMGAARMAGVEVQPTAAAKPQAPPAEAAPVVAPPPPERPDTSSAAEWAPPAPTPARGAPASQEAPAQASGPPPAPAQASGPPPAPTPGRGRSKRVLVGAGVGVFLLLVVVAVVATQGGDGGGNTSSTTASTRASSSSSSSASTSTVPPTQVTVASGIPAADEPLDDDVILFSYDPGGNNYDVLSIRSDGSGRNIVLGGGEWDYGPVLSPDRRSLAWTHETGQPTAELWVAGADGSSPQLVLDDMHAATGVSWSPDGRSIVFTSSRGGTPDVWTVDVPTGSLRQITDDPVIEDDVAWSPDGRFLALWRDAGDGRTGIWSIDLESPGGTALTSALTQVTDGLFVDTDPVWHPDGQTIAFNSNRTGNGDLYIVSADGGEITQLTDDPTADQDANWSPDGRSLAFSSERDGNRELYVVDADGANERRLTDDPGFDGHPTWST